MGHEIPLATKQNRARNASWHMGRVFGRSCAIDAFWGILVALQKVT